MALQPTFHGKPYLLALEVPFQTHDSTDIIGCESVLFEWAESYDSKDWERLQKCIAPSLRVSIPNGPSGLAINLSEFQIDYREFIDKFWEQIPAADFVAMASDPHFLGNPRLKTQHFIGMTKWEKLSETKILGHHQMRVAHQKYADDEMKEVLAKGHTHGSGTMTYCRVDGVWLFAGIEPHLRWTEFGGEGIFESEGKEKSNGGA
ncbi:hypothetical protein ARAM_005678 [Aspergillus rambellii]|uniref:Scytalone dehydratase-like domain-containing protein n=1 Tax=Aspergillus rambellii TaxID=308745 RepID=A0A0F8XBY2_9EURO|nr:hypothetical protein ARAM_005678 [Aspergillus rambellii]